LLNRDELDRIALSRDPGAQHEAEPLSVAFYGISDTTEPTHIFGGMQTAGALAPGGDVWFPSNRGPLRISTTRAPDPPLPPVAVIKVVADGREVVPSSNRISLPANNSRLEINYTSVMMSPQDAVRFKYKLESYLYATGS